MGEKKGRRMKGTEQLKEEARLKAEKLEWKKRLSKVPTSLKEARELRKLKEEYEKIYGECR